MQSSVFVCLKAEMLVFFIYSQFSNNNIKYFRSLESSQLTNS